MSTATTLSARQRIMEVATELFYREGVRAVGVDRIIEESGVAKATLYRYFATKDDLITAYLDEQNRLYWEWFDRIIAACEGSPREQLYAYFEALQVRQKRNNYRGCAFINISTEFPQLAYPGHRVSIEHKNTLRNRLHQLAVAARANDPALLAEQLLLVVNGASASATLFGEPTTAFQAKSVARLLIDAQLG